MENTAPAVPQEVPAQQAVPTDQPISPTPPSPLPQAPISSPPPQLPNSSSLLWKIIAVGAVVLVIILSGTLLAGNTFKKAQSPQPTPTVRQVISPTLLPTPSSTISAIPSQPATAGTIPFARNATGNMNQVVTIDKVSMEVTDVKLNQMPSKYDNPPAAGHQLIAVNITLTNNSSTNLITGSGGFSIIASDGKDYYYTLSLPDSIPDSATFTYGPRTDKTYDGYLHPGSTQSGYVIFEVPVNDSNLRILYHIDLVNSLDTESDYLVINLNK